MELWLFVVISTNLANSLPAQAGRPQSPKRQSLTFSLLSSFPFLPPNWNALPFMQMFFLILLSYVTEQLIISVTVQLSILGHFQRTAVPFQTTESIGMALTQT